MIFQLPPPYKSIETQIWTCRKKVNGQPVIIIWTNLVAVKSSMLYTKIQPYGFLDSGDEDFQKFLPYMDRTANLFSCAEPFEQIGIPFR